MPEKNTEWLRMAMATESRKILLAVTGGIACYKAADLCSKLVQNGASVRVAFSRSAHEFVTPLVFEALTGHPVYREVFNTPEAYKMEHISWARWADAMVVAPASADVIARMAHGLADDAVTTLYLAFRGDVYVAPSMNTAMLEHPATQENLKVLVERSVRIITPGSGSLACGEVGSGRMAEPRQIMQILGLELPEELDAVQSADVPKQVALTRLPDNSLAGSTVLITSGPTREYLDPVRFISNPSTGRMGFALANEAMRRGARVKFVTGPVEKRFIPKGNCEIFQVETARDMLMAVQEQKDDCSVFIFAAAVGDFRPAQSISKKIKRTGNSISLPLVENPDIAQAVGFAKHPGQITIGFAAETDDHEIHGQAKMEQKHLDAVVINDVSNPEIGFSSSDNEVKIVMAGGKTADISKRSKEDVAFEIFEAATSLLKEKAAVH